MRILCTGDLHLGRASTKITNLDQRTLSCSAAWDRIVRLALDDDERVDVVCLSGDLVDRQNRLYEGYGALRDGIRRLAEHNVRVFAVAGNHDYDVLPRIASELDPECFKLIGAGGEWEEVCIYVDGKPALRLVGWSYPSGEVKENPLRCFPSLSSTETPTIAILHADAGTSASVYAPVPLDDLRAQPVDMWLLGHIHLSNDYPSDNRPMILNPGSPQAMHPEEPGMHGPWIIELSNGRLSRPIQVPISSVTYCVVPVDVSRCETALECQNRASEALEVELDMVTGDALRVISCRVRLEGETDAHGDLDGVVEALREQPFRRGDVQLDIERIDIATTPIIDLLALAKCADAMGTLARVLISIDNGTVRESYPELLESVAAKVREVHSTKVYMQIRDSATGSSEDCVPDDDLVISLLKQECRNLLAALRSEEVAR
ncbi:MAG: DNA repair exonuclease [Armatimonadota bacterium]|nr:DNA repair exonuclease [bacterium]